MKIVLSESQVKNLVTILSEAFEAVPFELFFEDEDLTEYGFKLNGLDYYVNISLEDENYYSLSFGFTLADGHYENNPDGNANLDLKHLNTVLYTTAKITEDFVEHHPDIQVMIIHASPDEDRGESDEDDNANIRTRIYTRFLKTMNLNIKGFDIDESANRIFVYFT